MQNAILDQTTLEDSFFFCEYAKRKFEVSHYNNNLIEKAVEHIKITSKSFFNTNIPVGMQIDLLSDGIRCYEAIIMGLRPITSFEGNEEYINDIRQLASIEELLRTSNIFKVCAAWLPFPYDMADIASRIKSENGVPITFKTLERSDKRCVINFHRNRNYVFFGIDKNLSTKEMIELLKQKATLFKSINNYENCMRKDILKGIHKKSKSKNYRQTLDNAHYKSIGLLLYDLYMNKHSMEYAFEELRRMQPTIKCRPTLKNSSGDCNHCGSASNCKSQWKKQFFAAVDKIKETESQEEWLKIIKETPQRACKRRPVSFFEYEFGTVPIPPEK